MSALPPIVFSNSGLAFSLRGQTWRYPLASRARQFISAGSFRTRRRGPFGRNGAILRHFERDAIPYALETGWPVEAAGFEPLHFGIRSPAVDHGLRLCLGK